MKDSDISTSRPPRWFVAVLSIMTLPILGYPLFWAYLKGHTVAGINDDMMQFLVYALPGYIIASQWLSYWIYNERKNIAWVLQAMLLITYALCVWLMHLAGAF